MKMEVENAMGWSWVLEMSRYITLKGKTKQKPPEVERAREGKSHNRGKLAPPRPWGSPRSDRGCHHGLAVAAAVVAARLFPPCAAFWSFGVSRWAAGSASPWGILGLFLLSYFDPHGPHFLAWIHQKHFSQNLGLNYRNLQ